MSTASPATHRQPRMSLDPVKRNNPQIKNVDVIYHTVQKITLNSPAHWLKGQALSQGIDTNRCFFPVNRTRPYANVIKVDEGAGICKTVHSRFPCHENIIERLRRYDVIARWTAVTIPRRYATSLKAPFSGYRPTLLSPVTDGAESVAEDRMEGMNIKRLRSFFNVCLRQS